MTLDRDKLQQAMAASLTHQTMQKIAGAQAAVFESVICDIYRVRRELDKAEDVAKALAMIDSLADKSLKAQQQALAQAARSGQLARDLREAAGMTEPEPADESKDRRSCAE